MDATSADAVRDTPDAVRDIDLQLAEIKGVRVVEIFGDSDPLISRCATMAR